MAFNCFKCGQPGHVSRECPWSADLENGQSAERLAAQHHRCTRCRKVTYAWEKDLACDAHRVVSDWQAYCHSDQFVADCAEVRALAARQAAESREQRFDSLRAENGVITCKSSWTWRASAGFDSLRAENGVITAEPPPQPASGPPPAAPA